MIKRLALLLLLTPLGAYGAINPVPVQCVDDDTEVSGTVNPVIAAPTTGNILTYHVSVYNEDNGAWTFTSIDADFTTVVEEEGELGFSNGTSDGWGIADGTTSFTFSISSDVGSLSATVCEWDVTDLDDSGVDDFGIDHASSRFASTDTTISLGSATNSTANALVIYIGHARNGTRWQSTSVDNGTIRISLENTFPAGTFIASEAVTSTGAQSATFTTTDTGSENVGVTFIFAEDTVSVTYDADNYDLGDTVTATPVGYSALTQIQETVGLDTILDGAGETFVLCSLSDLTPAGACNNTELGLSLTWNATDGVDTAGDTFTIDFPAVASVDHSGDVTCIAGTNCPGDAHDAWVSPVTSGGTPDDYYCRFTAGSGTVNGSGVVMLDGASGTVECRIFDDSTGAWLAAASQEFTAPPAGPGGDECRSVSDAVKMAAQILEDSLMCFGDRK